MLPRDVDALRNTDYLSISRSHILDGDITINNTRLHSLLRDEAVSAL